MTVIYLPISKEIFAGFAIFVGMICCLVFGLFCCRSVLAASSVEHILQFPSNRSVGVVRLIYDPAYVDPKVTIFDARGAVRVPPGRTVFVVFNDEEQQAFKNLSQQSAIECVGGLNFSRMDLSDKEAACLSKYRNMVHLNLNDTSITDRTASTFTAMDKLSDLSFCTTKMTAKALPFLQTRLKLKVLYAKNVDMHGADLSVFKAHPIMRELRLSRSNLTDESLATLPSDSKIDTLAVDSNSKISDQGVKCVTRLKELKELDLSRTAISVKCIQDLQKLPKLRILRLSFAQFKAFELLKIRTLLPDCRILDDHGKEDTGTIFRPFHSPIAPQEKPLAQ